MLLYLFCFLTAAGLLAADQWTKFWVESHMALEEIRPLLPPVLELHAVHNYGAAWSLFAGARWVLVGVTAAMMLAVALALILRLVRHPLGVFSAFLILSGGVGNLLDRIFQGYVVDMLRFPFWTSYPTFNVADICVVTGCVLWLLYVLFVKEGLYGVQPEETPPKEEQAASEKAAPSGSPAADNPAADRSPGEAPASGGWDFSPGGDAAKDSGTIEQTADSIQLKAAGIRAADAGASAPPHDAPWGSAADVQSSPQRYGADGPDAARNAETAAPNAASGAETRQAAFVHSAAKEQIVLPPVPPVLLSANQPDGNGSGSPAEPSDAGNAPRTIDPAILGGSPWKALLEEEDEAEAKAEARSAGRKDGEWDSAESFFGGTPFRKSDKNGRVWP